MLIPHLPLFPFASSIVPHSLTLGHCRQEIIVKRQRGWQYMANSYTPTAEMTVAKPEHWELTHILRAEYKHRPVQNDHVEVTKKNNDITLTNHCM